jgi:hypothetical protein
MMGDSTPPERYLTISEIVGSVYCEQKVVFDRTRGSRTHASVQTKAFHGRVAHKQFELEGRTRRAIDSRCFVASCVYGIDADETNLLREWRDQVLRSRWFGRGVICVYYAVSPIAVRVIKRSPWLLRRTRDWLDHFIASHCNVQSKEERADHE